MTRCTFQGGMASGMSISMAHTPVYVRVVEKKPGVIDALDLNGDRVYDLWDVEVYELDLHAVNHYKLCENPPDESVVRNNEQWRAWRRETESARFGRSWFRPAGLRASSSS